MTSATLKVSHFLLANYGWMLPVLLVPIIVFVLLTDAHHERAPVHGQGDHPYPGIGPLLHKMSIEIYARLFHGSTREAGRH